MDHMVALRVCLGNLWPKLRQSEKCLVCHHSTGKQLNTRYKRFLCGELQKAASYTRDAAKLRNPANSEIDVLASLRPGVLFFGERESVAARESAVGRRMKKTTPDTIDSLSTTFTANVRFAFMFS